MRDYSVQDIVDRMTDDEHINAAYELVHKAMSHLSLVKHLDGELHRLLKDSAAFEDTLYQYYTGEGVKWH
jgi:hypothetical protein